MTEMQCGGTPTRTRSVITFLACLSQLLTVPLTLLIGLGCLHFTPPNLVGLLLLLSPLFAGATVAAFALVMSSRRLRSSIQIAVFCLISWPIALWLALFYLRLFY